MPPISSHQTAPYPPLPESLARGRDACQLRLRRFGTRVEDLQVDLSADPPIAITNVLARCTLPNPDHDLLWDLPVGMRIECLLVLAALDDAEEFVTDRRCQGCQQPFEVTLTIKELLQAGRAADRTVVEAGEEGAMRWFRRPTGRDQLGWLARTFPDEAAAVAAVIESLTSDSTDVPAAALEAALDEADPLVRAPVVTACPDCGYQMEDEIDLAGMALARLRRSQDSLFAAVDLLASRYHWSEAEILSLPEWRRSRYVALLQREGR
jgi:hypothetical protein